MENETRWQDIYDYLKAAGVNVYSPGQHKGECKAAYTVVKSSGSSQMATFSTDQCFYDLLCYVPRDEYSTLDAYVNQIQTLMKGLAPMIRPARSSTPSFYDDQIKGHMISVKYFNYRRILK